MQSRAYDLSRKSRVTWHALLAGGATTFLLIGLALVMFFMLLRQGMVHNAETLLNQWLAIFDESRRVLLRLNALDAPTCSPQMLRVMRYEAFQANHIKDIGAFRPGKMVCTTGLGVLPEPFDEGTPQIVTEEGYKIHVNTPMLISGLRESATILHIGRFNAIPSFPRAAAGGMDEINVSLHDPGSDKAFFLRQMYVPRSPDRLSLNAAACDSVRGLCVSIRRPWRAIAEKEAFTLTLMALGGITGGGLAGTLAAQAKNRRRTLLRQLRRSLATGDGFTLAYQPIIDIRGGQCVGAEALARWADDTGTPVPPDVFVPLAEENGLVSRLTGLVIARASHDLREFLCARRDFLLCINISADDLFEADLEAMLETRFLDHGVAPRQIVLELTERRLTDEIIGKATLDRLRTRGLGIAIDDFGTGYSSLASLRDFPFTELKIDRSFVHGIDDGAIKASLLPQIVDIARTLSLDVIAEGVETDLEEALLKDLQVVRAQGWLYSPAVGLADLLGLVARCEEAEASATPGS